METVKEIEKGSIGIIRIGRNEYQGHEYIDIRQYFKDKDNEYKPTKKGITFHPEILEEVIEGLQILKNKYENGE